MICRIRRATVVGAVGGPPVALLLDWLAGASIAADHGVGWLVRSVCIGIIFALAFSLLCGPPVKFVTRRLGGLPVWKLRGVVMITAFTGGSLAITIVAAILSWSFNLHFRAPALFPRLVFIDGALPAIVGLVILSHARLKAERDAQAARAESAALTAQI